MIFFCLWTNNGLNRKTCFSLIAFKAHEQLRALAASSAYDDAKASALAGTAAQAMATISLQQARLEQQLLAVLTPEQRKQAQQQREQRPGPRRPQ